MSLVIFNNHCHLSSCKGEFKLDSEIYCCKKCNKLFHKECYEDHHCLSKSKQDFEKNNIICYCEKCNVLYFRNCYENHHYCVDCRCLSICKCGFNKNDIVCCLSKCKCDFDKDDIVCYESNCKCGFDKDDIICYCEKCDEIFHKACYEYHCYVDHGVCFNCGIDIPN